MMPSPAVEIDDLEALFDQVAAQTAAGFSPSSTKKEQITASEDPAMPAEAGMQASAPTEVFERIGALTRSLHNALRELGYDKAVEDAVSSLPDARDRLSYIADLTGKAAERALAAVEQGQQYQNGIEVEAKRLAAQWERVFCAEMSLEEFKTTAVETRAFLTELPNQTAQTNAQLTEIMMAQDFHDLTGQVIQRVVKMAQNLETQLVKLLLETTPAHKRPTQDAEWLSGPTVSVEGRTDVVANQEQVDELLERLGF